MDKPLDHKTARAVQEEIRTRVFERYAEIQGLETQQSELQATLDALHEITNLPADEIEKIASDVIQKRGTTSSPVQVPQQHLAEQLTPPEDFTFERLRQTVEKKKRRFTPHLISYCCMSGLFIFLNIISSSFPWAIFPILGWGIGLVSHYFKDVRWPAQDLQNKIQLIKSQVHQILDENVPAYKTQAQGRIFNGVHRLVVAKSSQETLSEYLKNVDASMSDNQIKQATTQLSTIRDQYA